MVGHNGIVENIEPKDGSEQFQPFSNPFPPILEGLAGHRVLSCKESPPNAPLNAMRYPNFAV